MKRTTNKVTKRSIITTSKIGDAPRKSRIYRETMYHTPLTKGKNFNGHININSFRSGDKTADKSDLQETVQKEIDFDGDLLTFFGGKPVRKLRVFNLATPVVIDTAFKYTTQEKIDEDGFKNTFLKVEIMNL